MIRLTTNEFYNVVDQNETAKTIFKAKQLKYENEMVDAMRQYKDSCYASHKTRYVPGMVEESDEIKKQWVQMMVNNKFNMSLTLNFNGRYFSRKNAEKLIVEWWVLYNRHLFGRDWETKSPLKYIAVVENEGSNIHYHFAIRWKNVKQEHLDEHRDFILFNDLLLHNKTIFKQEIIIETLWKTVVNSGTAYVDRIDSRGWFYYMLKNYDYENNIIFDGDVISNNQFLN